MITYYTVLTDEFHAYCQRLQDAINTQLAANSEVANDLYIDVLNDVPEPYEVKEDSGKVHIFLGPIKIVTICSQ